MNQTIILSQLNQKYRVLSRPYHLAVLISVGDFLGQA